MVQTNLGKLELLSSYPHTHPNDDHHSLLNVGVLFDQRTI